jgi:integrase
VQFDSRAAKLLKAGDHIVVEGALGLRLVASTVGRAWVYRYKSPVDGRMRQIKLGTWPAMSIAQAAAEWERLRGEREAGHDPAQERRAARKATPAPLESTPLTVGVLVDAYAAQVRRAPKGAAELRRTLATMLTATDRARAPADVTRAVAYDLIARHADRPVQARNLRRELGAAWDWAHDAGRLSDEVPNWWRQVLRGKLASQGKIVGGEHQGVTKRVLTDAEVGAVLRHLPHVSRLPADLLTLYLWTGCRGAEIVAMEGREVSQDAAGVWWWVIPRAKLKMRRHPLAQDLPVPLIGRAADIVSARRDVHGDGHLFPSAGRAPHCDQKVVGVAVWWHMPGCELRPESVRARWPVAGWSPHDLRRTVRTRLAAMGCPSEVAEAVLGHIDPDPYRRHDYRAERLEWLTRLAACWESAASSRTTSPTVLTG